MSKLDQYLIFALTLFFFLPSNTTIIKLAILFPWVFFSFFNRRNHQKMPIKYFFVILFLLVFGLGLNLYDYILNGFYLKGLNVFVIDIFVYALLAYLLANCLSFPNALKHSIFLAASLTAGTHFILMLLWYYHAIDITSPVARFFSFAMGTDSNSVLIAYTSNPLTHSIFLIPFILTHFFLDKNRWSIYKKILLVFIILINFISLRMVLILLTIFVSLLLLLMSLRLNRPNARPALGGILAIFLLSSGYLFGTTNTFETFYSLKLKSEIEGVDQRYAQVSTWISHWSNAPLFGHGLTSVDMIIHRRDGEISYEQVGKIHNIGYEVTPFKLLAEIGFIGLATYLILLYFMYLRLFVYVKCYLLHSINGDNAIIVFGITIASICFFLASFTNGYILTFGMLYTLFFPFALLIHLKIHSKIPRAHSHFHGLNTY